MAVETLTLVKGKDKLELPQQNGNWVLARELGYSPVQMLVTAAAACGGYVYTSVLENSHVPAEIEKSKSVIREILRRKQSRSLRSRSILCADFSGISRKAIRCLKLVSPNCPVIQSLDPTITVAETVHFI